MRSQKSPRKKITIPKIFSILRIPCPPSGRFQCLWVTSCKLKILNIYMLETNVLIKHRRREYYVSFQWFPASRNPFQKLRGNVERQRGHAEFFLFCWWEKFGHRTLNTRLRLPCAQLQWLKRLAGVSFFKAAGAWVGVHNKNKSGWSRQMSKGTKIKRGNWVHGKKWSRFAVTVLENSLFEFLKNSILETRSNPGGPFQHADFKFASTRFKKHFSHKRKITQNSI